MWGWIGNGILAAGLSRVSIRRKATADIGAPRSLMKTYRPGFCVRAGDGAGREVRCRSGVDRRDPILESIDVQAAMDQINLLPAQRAQFGCAQAVPKGHQDHGGITMPVTIVSRCLHEPLNLALGEVLASAIFGIRQPTGRDCCPAARMARPAVLDSFSHFAH